MQELAAKVSVGIGDIDVFALCWCCGDSVGSIKGGLRNSGTHGIVAREGLERHLLTADIRAENLSRNAGSGVAQRQACRLLLGMLDHHLVREVHNVVVVIFDGQGGDCGYLSSLMTVYRTNGNGLDGWCRKHICR